MLAVVRRTAPFVGLASASALVGLRRRWWVSVVVNDLLGASGGPTSAALAVNEAGVVVGIASGRGFRWVGGRTFWLTELGVGSRAAAVDAAGSVAGARFVNDDDLHPVRWDPDGTPHPLPLPEVGSIGAATGISGSVTVGWCARPGRPSSRRAWIWDASGGRALAAAGVRSAEAAAVNGAGMIVGWTRGVGSTTARVWRHAAADPLSLPGAGGDHSRALDCNADGVIVGFVTSPTGDDQACVWHRPDAVPETLPTLEGAGDGAGARALGISNSGVIAGWSVGESGFPHACVWQGRADDGTGRRCGPYIVHDLGTLGGQTSEAMAVNDSGCVVGSASRGRGAISLPIRPGGWSWEDRAFQTLLADHGHARA